MRLKKFLVNPDNHHVRDIYPEPIKGQKVTILDYSLFDPNDVVRAISTDILITDVMPIKVGEGGDYHWEYCIYTNFKSGLLLLQNMYKLL
jgi:hypothetical protein